MQPKRVNRRWTRQSGRDSSVDKGQYSGVADMSSTQVSELVGLNCYSPDNLGLDATRGLGADAKRRGPMGCLDLPGDLGLMLVLCSRDMGTVISPGH